MAFNVFRVTALTAVTTVGFSSINYANANDNLNKPIELPTLQASITPEAGSTPATERHADRANITRHGIQSWHDLGRRVDPALNFDEQSNSINIRGLDRNRVQLYIDGIPNPWLEDGARGTSGGQQGFSFGGLSSISVYKGAGLRGSASLGGQVALQSIGFNDLLSSGRDFGFLGGISYSGYDDSVLTEIGLATEFNDRFRAMIYGNYKDFSEQKNSGKIGGFGTSRTKVNPASGHEKSALLRFEFDISPEHVIGLNASTFRHRKHTDSRDQQDGRSYSIGNHRGHDYYDSDRLWATYNYQNQQEFAILDRVNALVYWQKNKLDTGYHALRNQVPDGRAFIIPGNPFGYGYPYGNISRSNTISNRSIGGSLEAAGYLGDKDFYSHWVVGLDYQDARYRQGSTGYDNCPPLRPGMTPRFGPRTCDFLHTNQSDVPVVDSKDFGLQLQNTFAWMDDFIKLTPSIRYDYWKRDPKFDPSVGSQAGGLSSDETRKRSGHHWSPALLLEVNPHDNLQLYARYSHGFRAPTARELYSKYGSVLNYLRMGNANLKKETSRGFELGATWDSTELTASLAFFHHNYKNFIENELPVPVDSPYHRSQLPAGHYPFGVMYADNISKARIYGLEAATEWRPHENWSLRGGLAWAVGKDRQNDTYLNSVAPLKGYAGIAYDSTQWGADVTLNFAAKRNKVRYRHATPEAPHPDFRAPGYGTVDLGVYFEPSAIKGLRLQANLINAFDKKYWNALNVPTQGTSAIDRELDYYSSRGRYGMISLRYQY